jgi:hypothetical protein
MSTHGILKCALLLSLVSLSACVSQPDWYYHFICKGDADCLSTNPTSQARGDLNEGPDEINCTQLMTFAEHFWGGNAKNWCDNYELPGNGATFTLTYDGNGSTSGTVPLDPTHYGFLDDVYVLGNPGSLALSPHAFKGWNAHADGSTKTWVQGETFMITEDAKLFAIFTTTP